MKWTLLHYGSTYSQWMGAQSTEAFDLVYSTITGSGYIEVVEFVLVTFKQLLEIERAYRTFPSQITPSQIYWPIRQFNRRPSPKQIVLSLQHFMSVLIKNDPESLGFVEGVAVIRKLQAGYTTRLDYPKPLCRWSWEPMTSEHGD